MVNMDLPPEERWQYLKTFQGDIEEAVEIGEQLQDVPVGVGLDRVGDQRGLALLPPLQRVLQLQPGAPEAATSKPARPPA